MKKKIKKYCLIKVQVPRDLTSGNDGIVGFRFLVNLDRYLNHNNKVNLTSWGILADLKQWSTLVEEFSQKYSCICKDQAKKKKYNFRKIVYEKKDVHGIYRAHRVQQAILTLASTGKSENRVALHCKSFTS